MKQNITGAAEFEAPFCLAAALSNFASIPARGSEPKAIPVLLEAPEFDRSTSSEANYDRRPPIQHDGHESEDDGAEHQVQGTL